MRQCPPAARASEAVEKSYAAGKTDEFVEPVLLDPDGAMKDGDSVVFFNFRSDRAREISEAMTAHEVSPISTAGTRLHALGLRGHDHLRQESHGRAASLSARRI